MRLAGLVNDSIVDGPGIRMAVFAQGCPHGCQGCHNPDSWAFDGGQEADVEHIIQKIDKNPLLDGVTLSGGEPFAQAEAMAQIGRAAKQRGLNVVTFTGYRWEQLTAKDAPPQWQALLQTTDVLVDGPFVLAQRSLDLTFRGSKNQRIIDVPASLAAGELVLLQDERWA